MKIRTYTLDLTGKFSKEEAEEIQEILDNNIICYGILSCDYLNNNKIEYYIKTYKTYKEAEKCNKNGIIIPITRKILTLIGG